MEQGEVRKNLLSGNKRKSLAPNRLRLSLRSCRRLSRCSTNITDLPDDVLADLLSFLPTKDAAATSLLSTKLRRAFSFITSIDLDDSPISHCLLQPHLVERLPSFVNFVNSVLSTLSLSHHDLLKFRLRVGKTWKEPSLHGRREFECQKDCFPDLDPLLVNKWISFPITRNIREIDLCLFVRNPGQLPLAFFTCETLEVLKLDVNLHVDEAMQMPHFHLPNLRVLHFNSMILPEDDFVSRLISSCPSLEELFMCCRWKKADSIKISSHSLLTLELVVDRVHDGGSSLVFLLDTPNLQHLRYCDNLAVQTNVTYMSAIVKASINITYLLEFQHGAGCTPEDSFHSMLCLIRPLSNVQYLSLFFSCMEAFDLDEIKDELPVFRNLRHLELGRAAYTKWNLVLPAFLICSPSLETLTFPEGLSDIIHEEDCNANDYCRRVTKWEREFCRTTQAAAWLCWSSLTTIVIRQYCCQDRELELVKFFLSNASVLEKLVISDPPADVDLLSLERTLKKLPKASIACSIEVSVKGLSDIMYDEGCDADDYSRRVTKWEREFCRTTQAAAWLCWSSLTTIVICRYRCQDRELEIVKFFLSNTSVLEKLVICDAPADVDLLSLERTLKKLPKASIACSIEVSVKVNF